MFPQLVEEFEYYIYGAYKKPLVLGNGLCFIWAVLSFDYYL